MNQPESPLQSDFSPLPVSDAFLPWGAAHETLRELLRQQSHFAHDMPLMLEEVEPALPAFAQQVVERHVQMIHRFHQEIGAAVQAPLSVKEAVLRMGTSLHYGWMQLRTWLLDVNAHSVLNACAAREQKMLVLYDALLGQTDLPELVREALERHHYQLALHLDKLQWVHDNVVKRA